MPHPNPQTADQYIQYLADTITESYPAPPKCGDTIIIQYDNTMLQRLADEKHDHRKSRAVAVRRAISTMYNDVCESKFGKQSWLKHKLHDGGRFDRFLDLMMRTCPIKISIPGLPITPMRDISAEVHTGLVCTDGTVIGVDAQQLTVTHYQVQDASNKELRVWIPAETYVEKVDGYIFDKRQADVQHVLLEDLSNTTHPRRILCRVRRPYVGALRHGDHIRIYGHYDAQEKDHNKPIKNVYIDTYVVQRLPAPSEARLTDSELAEMQQLARTDPDTYLARIVDSVAPDIIGNRAQKTIVILSALKGHVGGDSRNNLHVLLMDSPGSGKSALLKWIAEVLPKSTYVDAPNATAQGLLYGQDDVDGRKILRAGAALRHDLIIIDEVDKMPAGERQKMYSAIEQQIASYHKVPFDVNTHLDLGMIAAGNPAGEHWDKDKAITENTSSVESAFISRCIVTKMEPRENDDSLVDILTGAPRPAAPYTSAQVAGAINHCRSIIPEYTPDTRAVLKKYLHTLRDIKQEGNADLPIDTRKEIDLIRVSSAMAKLLHRDTVDADSVRIGADTYMQCLRHVGMTTSEEERPQQQTFNDKAKPNAEHKFLDLMRHASDEDGTIYRTTLVEELVKSGLTDYAARNMIDKMLNMGRITEPTTNYYKSAAD